MDEFFIYNPLATGSKGLVFVGENVLVYRRDAKTTSHPMELDLPGGGAERDETPFETFKREVKEEFGLDISPDNIVYVRKYPSQQAPSRFTYYPVAKLRGSAKDEILFGNEGAEYILMPFEEYINREDAWVVFQERALDYARTLR